MSGTTRQVLLLGFLLVVLAAVLTWQLRGSDPAIAPAVASNPAAGGGAQMPEAVTDVRLELLSKDAAEFSPPRRDPFRFRAARVAAPAKVEAPPPPPVPPRPTTPARPPISASIRLIGIYEVDGRRVAVLHDGTQNPPIHRSVGDIVEGRYRVLRVDEGAVELAYLDGGSPQRIPLPGQ